MSTSGNTSVLFKRAQDNLCDRNTTRRREFSTCTLEDVQATIKDIQDQQGPKGKLTYLGRLTAFIEAMEQFGKVVEVFLNTSQVVCFVWVRT